MTFEIPTTDTPSDAEPTEADNGRRGPTDDGSSLQGRAGDGAAPEGVRDPTRQSTARGAIVAVLVAAVLLAAFEGPAVLRAGERAEPGWQRDILIAVGTPIDWVARKLPFSGIGDRFNAVISGDLPVDATTVSAAGGAAAGSESGAGTGPSGVTAEAFDPVALGGAPVEPRPLRTLLVTGDSMSMPLDAVLGRRLAGASVKTVREPHIGTGISQSEIVDWVQLAGTQIAQTKPDATVLFLGANEGYPMRYGKQNVDCCGPEWAAAYATRARRMLAAYRSDGTTRTYWLLLPLPRDVERREAARAVNAAIRVAAVPYRGKVRLVDLERVFTPDGRYRDAMPVSGRRTIVREPDGIHLNEAGAQVAADVVLAAMRADYGPGLAR